MNLTCSSIRCCSDSNFFCISGVNSEASLSLNLETIKSIEKRRLREDNALLKFFLKLLILSICVLKPHVKRYNLAREITKLLRL
jgi:hypothetical protein